MLAVLRSSFEYCCDDRLSGDGGMHAGTLISDLLSVVEAASGKARKPQHLKDHPPPNSPQGINDSAKSESEKLAQALSLSTADGDLGLFFVVHPQLVRTLEPGDDLADSVDVHQVGSMGSPE